MAIIRSLVVKLTSDTSALAKDLRKSAKTLKNFGRNMEATGQSLTNGITMPLAAIGLASTKMAADFEVGMAKVATIADTSTKSLSTLSKEVLNISDATGIANQTISETMYQAISAGADTADAFKLVEVSAKAAVGGFTQADVALDGLTSVMNTYNIATKEAESVANRFLVTQNKGKTTVGALAQSIGDVAPMAKAMKVSLDELLGSTAALTANGLATDRALTGFKSALTNIVSPSEQALDMAKELGLEFSAEALAAKGLVGFLEDIKDKTHGDTVVMSQLFGNVKGLNAMLSLTSDEGMAKLSGALTAMETDTTALDDAFNTVADTTSYRFTSSINELKNSAITLGTEFLPVIDKLSEGISNMTKNISALTDKEKESVLRFAGMAAIAGPALLIGGKVIGTIGTGVGLLAKAIIAFKGSALAATIAGAASVAAGYAAILAGVAEMVYLVIKQHTVLRDRLVAEWETIKASAQTIINFVVELFYYLRYKVVELAGNMTKDFIANLSSIADAASQLPGQVGQSFRQIYDELSSYQEEITNELTRYYDDYAAAQERTAQSVVAYNHKIDDAQNAARISAAAVTVELKNQISPVTDLIGLASTLNNVFRRTAFSLDNLKKGTLEYAQYQKLQGIYDGTAGTSNKTPIIEESIAKIGTATKKTDTAFNNLKNTVRSVITEIRSQTSAFAEFIGLFDKAEKNFVSGESLLRRLKGQVMTMRQWQEDLATLQTKGVSDFLINQLRAMGPGAANEIAGLARLNSEQLAQYQGLYNQKYDIAAGQAASLAGYNNAQSEAVETQINLIVKDNYVLGNRDIDDLTNRIISRLKVNGVMP